jgi:hypothetical protein
LRDNPLIINLQHLPQIISTYKEDWKSHILEYLKRYGKEDFGIAAFLSES